MAAFTDWIIQLENLGLLDVLLPFLLIFTITYAVLQKSKILGDRAKNFNTIVSFVLAMATIIPHVIGRGPDVVVIINRALPNVSVLMIACMMALLLMGVFGKDITFAGTGMEGWIVIFAIVAVGYTFLVSSGFVDNPPSWLGFMVDPETRSLLVAILVFGIVVSFITREEDKMDERKPVREIMEGILGGGKH